MAGKDFGNGRLNSFRNGVEAAIPALRRYARALTRNSETADDLVQDTLVRALRSEHLFHGGDVRAWLYTILTNLNRNRLRSLARRPVMTLIGEVEIGDDRSWRVALRRAWRARVRRSGLIWTASAPRSAASSDQEVAR